VHGCVWDVSRAAQPRLALEMALLKAIQLSPADSIPELIARVDRLAAGLGPDDARKVAAGAPGGRSSPANFRPH
jgi:DNA polymerase III subunit gamma/tau